MTGSVNGHSEDEEWNQVVAEVSRGEWGDRSICDFVTVGIESDVLQIVKNQMSEIIQDRCVRATTNRQIPDQNKEP